MITVTPNPWLEPTRSGGSAQTDKSERLAQWVFGGNHANDPQVGSLAHGPGRLRYNTMLGRAVCGRFGKVSRKVDNIEGQNRLSPMDVRNGVTES
jgi:hypothetical protein